MAPVKILVIGGGLGGLCLAQGLSRTGFDVAVFEKNRGPADRLQEYRIRLNPDASRALQQCLPPSLWDRFVAASRACGPFRFLTEQLEPLLTFGPSRGRHISIGRNQLRQVLLQGMDRVVDFSKVFQRYEVGPTGRVAAFFEDGSAAEGDLLVAADGNHSRVRKQYLPLANRIDTGVSGTVGKVILDEAAERSLHREFLGGSGLVLAPGGRSMYFGPHRFDAKADDHLLWALVSKTERHRFSIEPGEMAGPALRTETLNQIQGWHPAFSHMVSASEADSISCVRIGTSVCIEPWTASGVTLIGDAIHGMTPYRGIGASAALKDAAALCGQLGKAATGQQSLVKAVATYESEMRAYGFAAAKASTNALKRAVDGGAMARAGTRTLLRTAQRFPWLRDWLFSDIAG
jgi:2-polyprenyl-6-methoxyphenol hydroxylase-like FAD-dependent oxidoreductase